MGQTSKKIHMYLGWHMDFLMYVLVCGWVGELIHSLW